MRASTTLSNRKLVILTCQNGLYLPCGWIKLFTSILYWGKKDLLSVMQWLGLLLILSLLVLISFFLSLIYRIFQVGPGLVQSQGQSTKLIQVFPQVWPCIFSRLTVVTASLNKSMDFMISHIPSKRVLVFEFPLSCRNYGCSPVIFKSIRSSTLSGKIIEGWIHTPFKNGRLEK